MGDHLRQHTGYPIDTSEFLVAVAASLGFLLGIGAENVNFGWVAALLVGGG
ncbi:hypothetical protein [Micromonospora sp. NPDC005172]|uniref:hypothetical protein n=1 Tax=Micromonospora sp. NPDC005172 TaxID=3156867 RepID=UPI0033A7788A